MKHSYIAIFDMDGTLVETDAANGAAYNCALRRFGMDRISGFYGRVSSESIRRAGVLSNEVLDEVVREKVERYCHELWRTRLGPATDALRCVLMNREVFDKVVLLTDSTERRTYETIHHWGIEGFFDEIVCNGGQGNKYANYFNAFDSDPAACVVWENEDGQIKSAIAAGVQMENIRKVG